MTSEDNQIERPKFFSIWGQIEAIIVYQLVI